MDEEIKKTEQQTSIVSFKCPSCGSDLVFDPTTQSLKCPYCGTTKEIENVVKVSENPFENGLPESAYSNDVEVFRCTNCGALSEKTSEDIATECPYCHKTVVTKESDVKGIKPHGVVTFKLDKHSAAEKAKKWLKSRFYARGKMKKADFDTLLNGCYYPCWTFDANTYSAYKGRLGKYVTRTTGSGKNRKTTTEIRWFNVHGNIEKTFDDLVVYSGKALTDKQFDKVCGFNTNGAEKYDKSYLAGFNALHYAKDFDESWQEAKTKIDETVKSDVLERYHADVVGHLNINTSFFDTFYKYILLPFYVGGYMFGGKNYNVVVNGENGKTFGKYPLSVPKIILTVMFGLIALVGIVYLMFVME